MSPTVAAETAELFPVVMLYDHLSSVGVAMDTFSQLTRELEHEFETELRVWRMDDATSPDFSAAANHDIAAAEVIILSFRGTPAWPQAFRHWQSGTTLDGVPPPHGVVTVIHSDDEPPAVTENWSSVLRGAATQIHPEVFVYEEKPAAERWASPADPEAAALAGDPGLAAHLS